MRRMEEAAPQAAQEDVEEALAYLELLYGDTFDVGHDEQGYWAKPDGSDKVFRADDATSLTKQMEGWLAR